MEEKQRVVPREDYRDETGLLVCGRCGQPKERRLPAMDLFGGKERIVRVLREKGHTVGFLGDGINDAPAMRAADVGISVDTAADIAKEAADVILLEKDLTVVADGVVEGRKTYANMMKYIKITASSNFGNVLSVLAASAFLPFLPMRAVQLVLLNLVYDLWCTAMPWDNVDASSLEKPSAWDGKSVTRNKASLLRLHQKGLPSI